MMRREEIRITLAGANGAAAGAGRSAAPLYGELVGVHIDYLSQPATTDVVVSMDSPALTLLTVSDSNTDGWSWPREEVEADIFERYPLVGYVTVAVDDGNAGDLVVTLVYAD